MRLDFDCRAYGGGECFGSRRPGGTEFQPLGKLCDLSGLQGVAVVDWRHRTLAGSPHQQTLARRRQVNHRPRVASAEQRGSRRQIQAAQVLARIVTTGAVLAENRE